MGEAAFPWRLSRYQCLKDARERRDETRKLAAVVVDPRRARKAEKAARVERVSNSFEGIARVGLGKKSPTWVKTTLPGGVQQWLFDSISPQVGRRIGHSRIGCEHTAKWQPSGHIASGWHLDGAPGWRV